MGDNISIDWGNQQPVPNVFNSFMAGQKLARDAQVTREADNARRAALANPNDLGAVNAFATYDPQGAAALRANITNQAYAPALAAQLASRPGGSAYAAPQPNAMMPAPQASPQGQPTFDQAFGPDTQRALQTPGAPLPALPQQGAPAASPSFNQAFGPDTQQALQSGSPLPPVPQGQAPQVDPATLLSPAAPHMQAIGAAVAQGQISSPNDALVALARVGGPEAVQSLVTSVGQMDVQRRLNLSDANDALGSAAQTLLGVPQSQRAQVLQQMAPQLAQHGVSTEQINQEIAAGLTDQQLQGFVGQSLGVKGVIDAANKQRELGQTDKQIANQTDAIGIQRDQLQFEKSKGVMTPTGEIVNPTTGQLIYNPDQVGGGTRDWSTIPATQAASLIAQGESGGDFNSIHYAPGQKARLQPPVPVSQMTIGDVNTFQHQLLRAPGNDNSSAIGAYQIVGKTLQQYAPKVFGENWRSVQFNQENQTKLFNAIYADAQRNGNVGSVWTSQAGSGGGASSTSAQAKAIAEGTAPPFTGRAAATGVGARIMRQVYEINPSFDARNYSPQAASYKSFTSGKDGQTVQALNNVAQHINTLDQLGDAMRNGNMPLFNKIAQGWANATGQAAPTNWDAARQIIGGEIVKAVAGGAGGQGDREEVAGTLARTGSPDQIHGGLTTIRNLIGSQFHTLKLKYETGTGRHDFEHLLVPDAQHLFGGGQPAGSGGMRDYGQPSGNVIRYDAQGNRLP